ncbi:PREDICTED: uncharacterized protein LOC105451066 [Wasmannia auropunctata]|uniref:uncharacterized protein LOC105451066 n=1 Tax=Wasmannia auropunctata TaxID=64793 RepID=UPI0005EEA57C|nr:PREDICTED: uncharacterized protein LOC105451066 [Wasmannia auropunctata]
MFLETDELEQQCEDAVFELCDARERYPLQCARELERCIKLTNEIHVSDSLTAGTVNRHLVLHLALHLFVGVVRYR